MNANIMSIQIMKIKSTVKKATKPAGIQGFCIVGNCEEKTTVFAELLQQPGASETGLSNATPDLDHWQSQTPAKEKWGAEHTRAVETIFKKNDEKFNAWYWQPKESGQVLRQWDDLSEKIGFIIVYTSPIETLNAAALKLGQLTVDAEKCLSQWREDTERLLKLYQGIPDRCAIVSTDTSTGIQVSLRNLTNKWNVVFTHQKFSEQESNPKVSDQIESYIGRERRIADLHRQIYQSMLLDVPSPTLRSESACSNAGTDRITLDDSIGQQDLNPGDYSNIGNELLDLQEENRDLTLKLHQVQEKFEQRLVVNRENLTLIKSQRNALEKVYNTFPDYWNIGSISTKISNSRSPAEAVDIELQDVEIDYKIISNITVTISLASDGPGISIKPTSSTWLSFMSKANAESLTIVPRQGTLYQGSNSVISLLGTTDWLSILELVKKLTLYANASHNEHQFPAKVLHRLREVLNELRKLLDAWPMVPRYDKITLSDTLQQGHYRSLGIFISNLTIGGSKWDKLFYRLATLDESGVTFGTNPRLEFPQDSKSALQNWFAETEDARGQRLELRFAKPDAMDLQVWSALAENDKLLIAGLISSLENQLTDLENSNEIVKTDWTEWHVLARSIRQIAAKKITAS